jgi:hypothetical protein
MTQIERIRHYEKLLDRVALAESEFENALENFRAALEPMRELDAYYGSEEWRQDLADDEAGKLPADLKRGVLSEDAAYDAVTDYRRLLAEMLYAAADAL